VKVLTHRSRYIEPAIVPEFGVGSSSAAEARRTAPIVQSTEEPIVVSKVPTISSIKARDDKTEEPSVEKVIKTPEIMSAPTEAKPPKVQKASVATPKRRRMASVLDVVLETTKALSPAPSNKIAETAKAQGKTEAGQAKAEAGQAEAKAGPSVPSETKTVIPEDKTDEQTTDAILIAEQDMAERAKFHAFEAQAEATDYIYRHASGKKIVRR
jgi:hypothetical protein